MADRLTAYLGSIGSWSWGEADCFMVPAGWVRFVTGMDPASGFRGLYRDETSCLAVLRAHGGALRLAAAGMASAGLKRAGEPLRGDVGMVRVPTTVGGSIRNRSCGAICVGPSRWAVMTGDLGIVEIDMRHVIAWQVPCG